MKGTEKQIAWATDIITTWKPHWDSHFAAGLERAEAKLAEARADDRGYSEERQAKRLARLERKVDEIKQANEIWSNLDDAARVIENRGVLMGARLAQGAAFDNEIELMAARIVAAFG